MSRTTKHLNSEGWLNSARAFFQISNVLLFGFADAPQRGAEADTDAILWLLAGVLNARIVQRKLCGHDSELGIAIKPFQSMRRKKLFRIPIANLAGTTHTENTRIESCDARNAALFRKDSVPKIIDAGADACDGADARDDRAPPVHAATLSALAST